MNKSTLRWVSDILTLDQQLGRHATADDIGPFSESQNSRRALIMQENIHDPAVAAIYAQVPVLEDLLCIALHVDHIVPVSRGGKHEATNLQIVPKHVNLQKSDSVHLKYTACL